VRSSFVGLETGLRALLAHRRAIDVIGHNIANSATPGYSRQVVELQTTPPYGVAGAGLDLDAGLVGTGVAVTDIVRVRTAFLDRQYRQAGASFGDAGARRAALEAVEAALGEPSDNSLRAALDRFWDAAQGVATNPETLPPRAALWEAATDVVNTCNLTWQRLSDQRLWLDDKLRGRAGELDALIQEAASLSRAIVTVKNGGGSPNDLLDKLDRVIDTMADIAEVRVVARESGAQAVYIGGAMVADEWGFSTLEVINDPQNGNLAALRWAGSAAPADLGRGELSALIEVRDHEMNQYLDDLDALVQALVQSANAVHQAGFGLDGSTGLDLFDPASVGGHMALNTAVGADLRRIAASATGPPGDGENARALAGLRAQPLLNGSTLNDYLGGMIARLGVDTAAAISGEDGARLLQEQVDTQRQSVSGVSLDEETTNLLRYQQAYAAAARYIAAVDEMLRILTGNIQ
jgi:flagellar hook-associated protein 1 FlgK